MKSRVAIALAGLVLAGCAQPRAVQPEQAAVVIRDFSFPWSERVAPRTECRLEVRGDRLHFSFDVEDRDVVVESAWRGESTVDAEDRVELFFADDEALNRYWCVEIDPLGRVHDYAASHYRKFDSTWNCAGLKTSARRTADGYQVEGSLPLATLEALLGRRVASGTTLRLGLFRAEFYGRGAGAHGDAPDNWLSWARPAGAQPDFHVPSAFRRLRLP